MRHFTLIGLPVVSGLGPVGVVTGRTGFSFAVMVCLIYKITANGLRLGVVADF
jgi:hypothetical protein